MKTKKAAKKLDDVETLLSEVIDKFASADGSCRDLLESARQKVSKVKARVTEEVQPNVADKAPAGPRKRLRAANGSRTAVSKTS